jgi:hypothetical protein
VRAVQRVVGQALHLHRVLDAFLLLGRERQRGPPVGGLLGDLGIAVVGDLDLDHALDRLVVAAHLLGALADVVEQVDVELRVLARRADEAVADAAGELGRERARRRDVDRHGLVRPVVDRGAAQLVVVALEVDALLGPQQLDDVDRLGHLQPALLAAGELAAGDRRLVHGLAGTDAEEDPAGGEAAERREGLGDDRRVVAHRRRQDAGAEDDLARGRRGGAEPGEDGGSVAAVVAPRLQVVGDAGGLEAARFGVLDELEQLRRPELLVGRLVTQGEVHTRTLAFSRFTIPCRKE